MELLLNNCSRSTIWSAKMSPWGQYTKFHCQDWMSMLMQNIWAYQTGIREHVWSQIGYMLLLCWVRLRNQVSAVWAFSWNGVSLKRNSSDEIIISLSIKNFTPSLVLPLFPSGLSSIKEKRGWNWAGPCRVLLGTEALSFAPFFICRKKL